MRHLAGVLAAALVFALVAPAFAQPFADVPTNHWAYDAIAELAAKGLIEGYPDGTFKGDRAMTRYEMAMVVARLLARIESIQIPSPAAPQVTKADLEAIQRLMNEFRAELAALGVRVTALEEELNAIKARLDNVRITGSAKLVYNYQRQVKGNGTENSGVCTNGFPSGCGLNGNPKTGTVEFSGKPWTPDVKEYLRIEFDGSVTPDVHFITALFSNNISSFRFNSSQFGIGSQAQLAAIDDAFFDWKHAFGLPVEFWLGRFGGGEIGMSPGYPIQFGPFGLLMNTTGDTWEDSTAESGNNVVDGLAAFGNWSSLRDLKVQAVIARVLGGTGGSTYFSGEDVYGGDVSVQVFPGFRVGGYYVGNEFTNPAGIPAAFVPAPNGPLWHLYGPGAAPTGSINPATANCPAVTVASGGPGIQCPALGTGEGGYIGWDILPGAHFDVEGAVWNDAVHGTSDSGYQGNFSIDLGGLTGYGHNLTLDLGYLYYGTNFYPPYGNAEADSPMFDEIYPGNAQGFLGDFSWDPVKNWTIYGKYFGGNSVSNGQSLEEYEAGVKYKLAPNTKLTFYYRELRLAGVGQDSRLRAQLFYSY